MAADILLSPAMRPLTKVRGQTPKNTIGSIITSSRAYKGDKIEGKNYYTLVDGPIKHRPVRTKTRQDAKVNVVRKCSTFKSVPRDRRRHRATVAGQKKQKATVKKQKATVKCESVIDQDTQKSEEPKEAEEFDDGSFPVPRDCIHHIPTGNGDFMCFIFPFTTNPRNTDPQFVRKELRRLHLKYHPDKVLARLPQSSQSSYRNFYSIFNKAVDAYGAALTDDTGTGTYDTYVRAYEAVCKGDSEQIKKSWLLWIYSKGATRTSLV